MCDTFDGTGLDNPQDTGKRRRVGCIGNLLFMGQPQNGNVVIGIGYAL